MELKKHVRKYFIMGSQNCKKNPEKILEEAAKSGITAFQFREKGASSLTGNAKLDLGHRLRDICFRYNILFFINDDIELAAPLEADGIHIGQQDSHIEEVREIFPDKYIGLSVSNRQELDDSPVQLADYVGVGPIYSTSTKEDAMQAIGTGWIRSLRQQHPNLPVVGIGGINEQNASTVLEAGADGIAVISAITTSNDIAATVRNL